VLSAVIYEMSETTWCVCDVLRASFSRKKPPGTTEVNGKKVA